MARPGAMCVEDLIRRKVAEMRRWRHTKLGRASSRYSFQFTVMTYNILSQNAIENHRYLYRNCNPQHLLEDYRISRILPEILHSHSDIICLQEVEQQLFETRIRGVFDSQGFASVFKRKTGLRSDGCAILWRRDKFHLLSHTGVDLRHAKCKILDRDNVGLIAVLRPNHPKSLDVRLHVATTHLLFNPRRGDIKLCQIRLLLAELEKLAFKEVTINGRSYHPTILCGDFNFEPHSPLYQFVEGGSICVKGGLKCGDLSGQAEGKSKGGVVSAPALCMEKIGIGSACRFLDQKNIEKGDPSHMRSNQEAPTMADPRWIATLMASGNTELARELSSRLSDSRAGSPMSVPNSPSHSESSSARCEPNLCKTDSFHHDFKFVPAYKYLHDRDKLVTSMTGRDFNTVDHIFYGVKEKQGPTSYAEGKLNLLSLYSLMHPDWVVELGGLPNACLGSDHICLMARFGLGFRR